VEFDFVNSLRLLALIAIVIVLISFAVRYGRAFRSMVIGPRYYFAAMICLLVTVAWDTIVLMVNHDDFSWRMLPLALGLTFSVIYLLEPHAAFRKRAGRDPLDLAEVSDEIVELRLENQALREELHQAIRKENATKLMLMATETINEGLKQSRRETRAHQEGRDQDRAGVRERAADSLARQDAEDQSGAPFEQLVRDRERAGDRALANDEIKRQDREDDARQ
jgi:hypothetical protein